MMKLFINICICLALTNGSVYAVERSDSSIIEHVQSNGNIIIHQPDKLTDRINGKNSNNTSSETHKPAASESVGEQHHSATLHRVSGYRIQVFADNNPKTGRNEALVRERNIMARFPLAKAYITYKAPVWRLKVGDFKSHSEANQFMHELKKAFPAYSREMIIVRDRVNVYM